MILQLSVVSRLKNEHFLELLGYCLEANNTILVYEHAKMGSLHDILHGMLSFVIHLWDFLLFVSWNFYSFSVFLFIIREERCTRSWTRSSSHLEPESKNCLWCCKRSWIFAWESSAFDSSSWCQIMQCPSFWWLHGQNCRFQLDKSIIWHRSSTAFD